ncbi:MAG: sulfurtransferase [Anaerolineales bacterium]|jgi:thiosulfate/3-mercaptopyruvate sulfurtransferase
MAYTTLISVQDLEPHLEDPDWLIVDCRFDLDQPDWSHTAYLEAHIPGAVFVDLDRDLTAPMDGTNGRHPLLPVQSLSELFSRLGIDEGKQVVAYDNAGGPFAARFWWCLRFLGHDAVAVLDGGIDAWNAKELPLHAGVENLVPSSFRAAPRNEMLVRVQQVLASLEDVDVVLLDSRSPERYRGEEEPRDPVAGRIPGALNRYWGDNLDEDGNFKPPEDLKSDFESRLAGFMSEQVIVYCGSGVTASHNLLALEHAGLHGARLYAGSWSEWCSDSSRPIASGEPNEGS